MDTTTATAILADYILSEPTPGHRVEWPTTAAEAAAARPALREALDRYDDARLIAAAQGVAWTIGSARCDGQTALALERMPVAERIAIIVAIASTTDCAYDDAKRHIQQMAIC